MKLITKCFLCGDTKEFVDVDEIKYKSWLAGAKIQDVFSDMSADDRERLQTGTCPQCWDKMFQEEEEVSNG